MAAEVEARNPAQFFAENKAIAGFDNVSAGAEEKKKKKREEQLLPRNSIVTV